MNKDQSFTQCKLQKDNITQVSFIPTVFAKYDNVIKLKNAAGVWEDGWIVIEVGQTVSKAHALEQERVHMRTRKASDI
jgi:hypothetical protein